MGNVTTSKGGSSDGMSAPSPSVPSGAPLGARLVLVGSAGVLALALNHVIVHWVLFTDSLLRRFLFGA
jgi:hypothetical protein